MKKPIFLFIAFIYCCYFSHSQMRLALAGGGHTASVNETNNLPNWGNLKNKYSARPGAHFGFIADLQLGIKSKFYFQPGIIFHNKGRKFSNTYDTAVYNYSRIQQNQFINYIDAPLNLVYKIPMGDKTKFFIGGGTYISFFYNGVEKTETFLKAGKVTTVENTDLPVGNAPGKYQTWDLGINGTAGIEFGKFFIAANYSRGLSDFYQPASYDGSLKHQVIGGTIGIFLGKPEEPEPKIKDKDGDGIIDTEDDCIDVPGPLVTKGCPDMDGDGIADKDDRCPTEKGLLANYGCPLRDSDGDGITDDIDKCKDVPGIAKYQGCPVPDTDGDGVNDDEDKCVNEFGKKENQGCPEIKKELIEKVDYAARRILFAFAKADLLKESETVLNEVVDILIRNPELKLDVEGHTSNDGTMAANMKLSAERAKTVMKYIINKGISAARLTSQGFGPTRPLNDGKTEEDKSLNRRVELKLRVN